MERNKEKVRNALGFIFAWLLLLLMYIVEPDEDWGGTRHTIVLVCFFTLLAVTLGFIIWKWAQR